MTTTARHRAPTSFVAMTLEAQARAASPQPDAPLTAVVLHLNAAHEQMAGRHAKPLDIQARVRNVAALREMRAVTR